MTRPILRCMGLAILSASLAHAWVAEEDAGRIRKVDQIFATIGNKTPGVAVSVRSKGRTVLQRGYGVTDLATMKAIDARTNFRLASCTKQFTAMAVMLLVHDGKLRYDQSLTDIFPQFPGYGKTITIRNLLNHTSGLLDYEDLMVQPSLRTKRAWTDVHQIQDQEVLELLESQKSGKFPPGSKWSYSNTGYVVLGLAVAEVSGETFGSFLHDRIFQPLKMNHTLAYEKGKNAVSNRAYGHSADGGRFITTDQSSTSATLGDGGIYSNLDDLARWDSALEHHTLLSATEMKPALAPIKLIGGVLPKWASDPGDTDPQAGKPVSYGFGWFLDPYKGHTRIWHYGDTVGFKSAIERFTDSGLTVIVLCNRSDLDPGALALKVADLYLTSEKQ